jgi:hypothetical protein
MLRREFEPGLDRVERQVRPPSREIRITGLIEQAAPGPRCSYTTAIRCESVGWVATTGSQARSATDFGAGLTRPSWSTRALMRPTGEGEVVGVAFAAGSARAVTAGDGVGLGAGEATSGVGVDGDVAGDPGWNEQPATIVASASASPQPASTRRRFTMPGSWRSPR